MQKQEHILLAHLVSNGDCLMATTIARQIKADHPGCHLTWAISYKCKQVILNNPFVDSIWEFVYDDKNSPFDTAWYKLKEEIAKKKFDKVFYTQIYPENELFYDGTTRSSTFGTYRSKITVPVEPVLKLYDAEIENVKKFVAEHKLENYSHRLIFECTPSSGQSEMNLDLALAISERLTKNNSSLIVVISTHKNFTTSNQRIVNGAALSYRENAELSRYCTFLVGCSSGISWLLTSDWAKKLPSLQILNGKAFGFRFASMVYDLKYWGMDTERIIETEACDVDQTTSMITEALKDFTAARRQHHTVFTPNNDYCVNLMITSFVKGNLRTTGSVFKRFTDRNGFRPAILALFFAGAARVLTKSFLAKFKKK